MDGDTPLQIKKNRLLLKGAEARFQDVHYHEETITFGGGPLALKQFKSKALPVDFLMV
jgi:hypothetical protein